MARILIVDDDKQILEEFQNVLLDEGHEASIASNGREAIQKFEQQDFDVVFLDVLMPKMEGPQILTAFQQLKSVPIIMMSGFLPLQKESEIMDRGAHLCLRKPLDLKQVRAVIASITDPDGRGM